MVMDDVDKIVRGVAETAPGCKVGEAVEGEEVDDGGNGDEVEISTTRTMT